MTALLLLLVLALPLARLSGGQSAREQHGASVLCWTAGIVFGLMALVAAARAADIPPAAAHAWQRTVTREAHAVWGLSAPTAVFGAQIQQESAWRVHARSPYADGLAQFTAATAADMARWYPELGPADAYDPRWAIRALVRYDWRLYRSIADTATDCDRWAMTLSAYNGGPGWLTRDRALCAHAAGCDPGRWWGHVALHSPRSASAMVENRHYPVRVLQVYTPRYLAGGWRGPQVCP